ADQDGPIVDTNDRSYQPSRPIQSTGNSNPHGPIADQDGRPGLPVRLPKSISSFMAGFKSAVNSKIDDYIDEYQLKIPKYNRNNHFFNPIITTILLGIILNIIELPVISGKIH